MEDILNMWTKELEKQTKDFHKQASQVAKWDQQLIENGNKVIYKYVKDKEKFFFFFINNRMVRSLNCMKM